MSVSTNLSEVSTPSGAKQLFIGLRFKLIIVFVLIFIIIDSAVFSWFYSFVNSVALQRIDSELQIILNGTAQQIDGDNFQLLAQQAEIPNPETDTSAYPTKEQNPAYWKHIDELVAVKKFETDPIRKDKDGKPWTWAKLYTFVKGKNEHEIIFVGSSSAYDGWGAQFKQICTDDPDDCTDLTTNYQALNGQNLVIQPGVYTDDFGSWHSGYQPIRNSQGEVVGAVGVDFQAEYLATVKKELLQGLVIASIFTFFVLFVLVWFASSIITRPLATLTKAADQIAEGEYDQNLLEHINMRFQDEVGRLAIAFNHMIQKIKSSHDELEDKVKTRTAELHTKLDELEKLNAHMTDRELKMIDLKKEIQMLKEQLHKN